MGKEKDVVTPDVRKADGKQEISKGGDFGARAAWSAAANPPSVKAMVGSQSEFAKVKHDQM